MVSARFVPEIVRCLVATGSIDLIDLLDATWSLGSGTLEQQVREYLQNARADYYRFRLNGFYDISIHLSDASFATCVVTVSADKKRMQLVYDIPGNQVDCTANLTSPLGWPDRDVASQTTVRIEVTMDVTGNLASPTRISGFRVSLHDTECWNDGILFPRNIQSESRERSECSLRSTSSGTGAVHLQLCQHEFADTHQYEYYEVVLRVRLVLECGFHARSKRDRCSSRHVWKHDYLSQIADENARLCFYRTTKHSNS